MSGKAGASRRQFLGSSGVAAAAVAGGFVPAFAWTSKTFANDSANDRPRIGCIGTGSMGTGDAHQHANFGDILAVCDVDNRHAERARNDDNHHAASGDSGQRRDWILRGRSVLQLRRGLEGDTPRQQLGRDHRQDRALHQRAA